MFKQVKIVIVTATRLSYFFPDYIEEITFAERVKENETPKETANRRAKELCELYKYENLVVTHIKVRIEKENVHTGNSTLEKEYFI